MKIRQMTIEDYDDIIVLLQETPGVTVRDADSKETTSKYLHHNSGLSFVAAVESKIVGCVMCGHDGRRGYLQHLVVNQDNRKQGIGDKLFMSCIRALKKSDISKNHIFVLKTNDLANNYWSNKDWQLREDINMYSYNSSAKEDA